MKGIAKILTIVLALVMLLSLSVCYAATESAQTRSTGATVAIIIVLGVAILFTLSASNVMKKPTPTKAVAATAAASPKSEAPKEATTYKVGVCVYKYDDNFMAQYRSEIAEYFASLETEELKYDVSVKDGYADMAEQAKQIDDFIAEGVDVLIVNFVESSPATAVNRILDDHTGQFHAAVDSAIRYLDSENNETYIIVDYRKIA